MAVLEGVKKIGKAKGGNAQEIAFSYYAPSAKKVYLAGKFNDWNTTSLLMKKDKDGTWRATVRLSPGKHEYKFFVDGAWVQDRSSAETVQNSYGTANSVINVQ